MVRGVRLVFAAKLKSWTPHRNLFQRLKLYQMMSVSIAHLTHFPNSAYSNNVLMYTELISDDVKPVKSDLSPAPEEQPTSTSNSETVSLFCAWIIWILIVISILLAGWSYLKWFWRWHAASEAASTSKATSCHVFFKRYWRSTTCLSPVTAASKNWYVGSIFVISSKAMGNNN